MNMTVLWTSSVSTSETTNITIEQLSHDAPSVRLCRAIILWTWLVGLGIVSGCAELASFMPYIHVPENCWLAWILAPP
jgi:hypothetical protein